MSVKDVEKYYQDMYEQYVDLQNEIKDFEKEAAENMLPPESLDDLKKTIEPFLINWRRITYFMYLLHKPTNKKKEKSYAKQSKKLLNAIGDSIMGEAVLSENKKVLQEIKHG